LKLYPFAKRSIDLIGALLGLLLAGPLICIASVAIWQRMGRPVFFLQQRPGRNERLFTCYKLRTMIPERNTQGELLRESERITKLGKFLRASSIDELPQLWNVLRGDLSLVGPRPLFISYLPYYTETERRRHSVRPGLTGLAQISGRNSLSFDERLRLDVWYVDHCSLWLDLRIMFSTIWIVLAQQGYATDCAPLDQLRKAASIATETSVRN
jgi:sugar transferase EpsL